MIIEGELTEKIIGAAIEVHKFWGPGLYEEIYEKSLYRELEVHGLVCESQLMIPLEYKGIRIGDNLRCDMFVEQRVVVENKAVKELLPVHKSQLLTYMRLLKARVGLLINYNVQTLKYGIKRMVL